MNKSLRKEVLLLFSFSAQHKNCAYIWNILIKDPFKYFNGRFPDHFIYLSLWNSYPFIYLKPEKVPLSSGASPYRPLYGVPPRASDRALLVTRALPCRLEKGYFLSQCLSPPTCIIAGVQGRGATPNLSYSRCEALGIVTLHHSAYSKHTGNPRDYQFLLWKSELRTSNSTARSDISSSQWRKIHSSPVLSFDICSTLI